MEQVTHTKQSLRKSLLLKRRALSGEAWTKCNESLLVNLKAKVPFDSFSKCFLFSGFGGEPNPCEHNFVSWLRQRSKIFLPVVNDVDSSMEFYAWNDGDTLNSNVYGICEPVVLGKQPSAADENTVILIPALAADFAGYRLGFGKGYYDRYLARFPKAYTVCLVFSDFMVSELPRDEFDIPVSLVVTD